MSVKEVTFLRKAGKLEDAFSLAKQELDNDPNEWTRMSMFWVLRDYARNEFIPQGEIDKAKKCLEQMGTLLPDMIDDSGVGQKAYQNLCKQILPYADVLKRLSELSKTDPNGAYNAMTAKFGKTGDSIDESLHEDFGWIVYRYMKANSDQLTSIQIRTLLRDYMLLKNGRPSMLHSTILNFALNFSKGHSDFSFYRFFIMWGVENLRYEDFETGDVEGKEIPSLISRICRTIIDTHESFSVEEFVNKFEVHNNEVVEYLRQAYFWSLMNLHKQEDYNGLWKAFECYAQKYSSLGPSRWHSEILKIANRFMIEGNSYRFFPFMKQWIGSELENLRDEDWTKEKSEEGKLYPSLATKSAKKCFEFLKTDTANRSHTENIVWLKQLYAQVLKHETEDDWSARNYAMICVWEGSTSKAIETYKSLLVNMGEKFYLWSELAECITDNNNLRIALLLKAKEIERNEDFLGDVHLSLAKLWIEEGSFSYASKELSSYAKHRMEKGWTVSALYQELYSKIKDSSIAENEVDTEESIQLAEDFVYANYKWHDYVLTEKWSHDGKEYYNFFDGVDLSFSVKSNRYKALKKAKIGTVYRFRCHVAETELNATSSMPWTRRTVMVKTVIPLALASSDREPWSLLPIKYGVVDYINREKNVLHILTQESKQVFCSYKKSDIQTDSFVKFREYESRRKEDVITHIVDVHICAMDEALAKMKSRIVVVDDVNVKKRLFHVVLGKNLISDIVRFEQTDIRPNIGDFLRITYCVKKNKEGKKHIKFLHIKKSEEKCDGLIDTIEGHLSVKNKEDPWEDDDRREPDFAFVKDFYVHRDILRKYGIKEDCEVIAKIVLCGDNKWKVYAIEIQ